MTSMNLDGFTASHLRSHWVEEPGLAYYVRKSLFFPGVIELANCNTTDPDGAQFGFWRFMKKYAHRIPFIAENVINEQMVDYLTRRGWLMRDVGSIPQFASPLAVEQNRGNDLFDRLYPHSSSNGSTA